MRHGGTTALDGDADSAETSGALLAHRSLGAVFKRRGSVRGIRTGRRSAHGPSAFSWSAMRLSVCRIICREGWSDLSNKSRYRLDHPHGLKSLPSRRLVVAERPRERDHIHFGNAEVTLRNLQTGGVTRNPSRKPLLVRFIQLCTRHASTECRHNDRTMPQK